MKKLLETKQCSKVINTWAIPPRKILETIIEVDL